MHNGSITRYRQVSRVQLTGTRKGKTRKKKMNEKKKKKKKMKNTEDEKEEEWTDDTQGIRLPEEPTMPSMHS